MSPTVSIIIPCLNEEDYIRQCLESVLRFRCPRDVTFEVLVMDGGSRDRSVELVEAVGRQDERVRLYPNPRRIQSAAINEGVRLSRGRWIMRLDAHAEYPDDYLEACLSSAVRTGADNVGGILITEAGGPTYGAAVVQALTTHKFGVGNSGFRTGAKEDWADTVPFGFFRREVFDRLGGLDERLVRAQDYEFNRRIIASGGKILRNPTILVRYFNQPSLGAFYKKQVFREAPYNAYMWCLAPYAFTPRHAITAVFSAGLLGGAILAGVSPWIAWPYFGVLALYGVLAVASAVQQAIRYGDARHVVSLPWCFFGFHFLHGLGLLGGIVRVLSGTAPVQKMREPWPGAGKAKIAIDPRRLGQSPEVS